MITKATVHQFSLSLWAVPKHNWEVSSEDPNETYTYEVRLEEEEPYREGSVLLYRKDMTLPVYGGIDLNAKQAEVLEEVVATRIADHVMATMILREKIQQLTCLEAPAE